MPVIDSWAGAAPSSKNKLIKKVCSTFGFSTTDSDFTTVALEALDDTVNDINTGLFEFNKTVESGIPFTAGDNFVTLSQPADFYREAESYVITNEGLTRVPLLYYPWIQFQRWFGDQTETGEPLQYSVYNFENDGKLYLHPTPDAATASGSTLTVGFYKRIPPISSTGDSQAISVPREIENALIYGAQKRVAIHIMGAGDPAVAGFARLEEQALDRLHRVDRLHPDERKQWILSDFSTRNKRRAQTDFFVKY